MTFTIFLAEVNDSLLDRRDGIIAQLKANGYNVVTGDPSTADAETHEIPYQGKYCQCPIGSASYWENFPEEKFRAKRSIGISRGKWSLAWKKKRPN